MVSMQHVNSTYKNSHSDSVSACNDESRKEQQSLPILPGMADAENQPIRINLPEEAILRLRRWK